jgi:RTX calcium-binding nonapeptide repeat (4 copies)
MQPVSIGAGAHVRVRAMRRRHALLVLSVAVALGVSAWPADARTVARVARAPDGVLTMSGTPESNPLSLRVVGGTYEFDGRGDPLLAGAGCERRTPQMVACAGDGVTGVGLATGGGPDEILFAGPLPSEVITVPITVSSGSGPDHVVAGFRTPRLLAPLTVDAGPGSDQVIGGHAADRLDGGRGVDRLYGGPGADSLVGGVGDDFLYDVDQAPSTLDCGAGADLLNADLGVDALIGCEQPPSEWGVHPSGAGRVEHRYAAYRNGTQLTRLRVAVWGPGATVTVTCRGGRCPSQPQHAGPQNNTFSGPWDMLGSLAGRRLRPGARVTVTMVSPGYMTKVVQLTMRHRQKPARETHCVGPISGMVTHHCRSLSKKSPFA